MRGVVKISGVIAASMAMMVGLSGCGNPFSKQPQTQAIEAAQSGPTLWESNLQYVRIVSQDAGALPNQHPLPISQEEMRSILESMYVNQRILLRTSQVPLFSPGELSTLSSTLARGLNQAGPNEDVNFVILGLHQGALASERRTNSARVFVDDAGRLNFVFGLIHEEYREKDQLTGQTIDRRVNPLLPGSRNRDSGVNTTVAQDNGISFYQDPNTGRERTDWVVIDIPTVLATSQQRRQGQHGDINPQLVEDIVRTKQETDNLRDDMSNVKEILFEMSDEIERLREELERLRQ